ncbi:MAG: NAD(P)/FAD-dependent oxidoreductase [Brevinema sp.]
MINKKYDVIIIGAGASGIMAAASALKCGKIVLVIDNQDTPLRKVRISGGGRCNFTNLDMSADHYLSQNPHFIKSALKQFKVSDFLDEMDKYNIPYYEKKLGQIFCQNRSSDIINYLLEQAEGADFLFSTEISSLQKHNDLFEIKTNKGQFSTPSVIIATGGLSFPHTGVSNFAAETARSFGLNVIDFRPALVPLKLQNPYTELSGTSLYCKTSIGKKCFYDDMLFTHKGLSGPAILKISSYWDKGTPVVIDLLPNENIRQLIEQERSSKDKQTLHSFMKNHFSAKLATWILEQTQIDNKNIQELSNRQIESLYNFIHSFTVNPVDDLGYELAEISKGGVDTKELSSKTFEAKKVPGLYFIGEAVDIAGNLGGYNIWFAFASGFIAGQCQSDSTSS